MDDIYWTQLFYYTIFLILVNFVKYNEIIFKKKNLKDCRLITYIFIILYTVINIVIEFNLFTEEYSKNKLYMRYFFVISLILVMIIARKYKYLFYHNSLLLCCIWFLGYFVTWIISKKCFLEKN